MELTSKYILLKMQQAEREKPLQPTPFCEIVYLSRKDYFSG